MDATMIDEHLENIDRRLTTMEQILPTLATHEALHPLDRRLARVEQILPALATREEVQAEGERSRRHMDVVAESLRSDIQLIAEHVASIRPKRESS